MTRATDFLRRSALIASLAATGFAGQAATPVQGAGATLEKPARAEVRDISALLPDILAKRDVPGMVVAIIEGDRVVALGACGVRERGKPDKIAIEDRFHLGSCTKSMTATLAAILVEEKKIGWGTTLAEVFPELAATMHPDWRAVTLEQLLSHRGGAPANLDAEGLWDRLWDMEASPPEQRRTLLEGVLRRPPEAPPGTKFIYSNAGVAIAGVMLETVMKKPWEELMRERLFAPLGMTSAGFGAPGTREAIDQPRGHRADGTAVEPGPGSDNPAAIGPAGTVHCSIGDWAKYVASHLTGELGGSPLISAASFAKLHAPAEGPEPKYALGWGIAERDWAGGRALTHRGSNTMWLATVWIAPQKNFALLVCTNQGGPAAEQANEDALGALIRDHTEHEAPEKH
jgi:CubicO group peptidase (beta-lactamase class C family)